MGHLCGIFFSWGMGHPISWPRLEHGPSAWWMWSLDHWTAREVPQLALFKSGTINNNNSPSPRYRYWFNSLRVFPALPFTVLWFLPYGHSSYTIIYFFTQIYLEGNYITFKNGSPQSLVTVRNNCKKKSLTIILSPPVYYLWQLCVLSHKCLHLGEKNQLFTNQTLCQELCIHGRRPHCNHPEI